MSIKPPLPDTCTGMVGVAVWLWWKNQGGWCIAVLQLRGWSFNFRDKSDRMRGASLLSRWAQIKAEGILGKGRIGQAQINVKLMF